MHRGTRQTRGQRAAWLRRCTQAVKTLREWVRDGRLASKHLPPEETALQAGTQHHPAAAQPCPAAPASRPPWTRTLHRAQQHAKMEAKRRRAPADCSVTPCHSSRITFRAQLSPTASVEHHHCAQYCRGGAQERRRKMRRAPKALASAGTCRSACCNCAAGGSGSARFLLSRAERSSTSGGAPLKVIGVSGGMFAQLVQRTSHRLPPQSTTRPRATRRRVPTTQRTRGNPRDAVVAAAHAGRSAVARQSSSQQLLRRRRSFTRSRRCRFC